MDGHLRLIFFGSDDFASTHLEALCQKQFNVLAVVCSPDKPQGRGMKMSISPVKQLALAHGLTCLQPLSMKDPVFMQQLKTYAADCFVVVSFGHLLPQSVLDIPQMTLNVHGSLLPLYRGAAPIQWAIINGDQQTGVSVQRMVLALDAGDVMAQEIIPIHEDTNAQSLRQLMAVRGSVLLEKVLVNIEQHKATFNPQDPTRVTYAPKLNKAMGNIDWFQEAKKLDCLIRGLYPWPGAYTFYQDKMIKILKARVVNTPGMPGVVESTSKEGILVGCGQGSLLLIELQPESSKVLKAIDFAHGQRLVKGNSFLCQKSEKTP